MLELAKRREFSKGDQGETSRVTRKLAEAYELKGDVARAREYRDSAEAMREAIQGPQFSDLEDTDLSYAMMSFNGHW